ncbi:MAG: nitronate monooxygenase [Flavobacteriales bacterium]|nr:nitronate monooxygenase [Flavobacteriales bacterium]
MTNNPTNRVNELFQIEYPIIQAGMIWCSGWRLVSAVSNAGGLGLLGAGSMYPDVLRQHIAKTKDATTKPFGVNVPLLYPQIDELMQIIVDEGVKVVFTSAGNPATWTRKLKDHGITVVHVISSTRFAEKAVNAGCDAVVAEGFEAGGHNGREETTTLCLIPAVSRAVEVPVIAAGGIYDGATMLASMVIGAEGVQVGSRFAATIESSAHAAFKEKIINANEGDTLLTLKELTPVRLLKNKFFEDVMSAYARKAGKEELNEILGRARAKKGMFEGDMEEGELEIGQVASSLHEIIPAAEVVNRMVGEYRRLCAGIVSGRFAF